MHLSLAFFQRSLHIFHFLPMFELYTYILSYIVVESVMVTFFPALSIHVIDQGSHVRGINITI